MFLGLAQRLVFEERKVSPRMRPRVALAVWAFRHVGPNKPVVCPAPLGQFHWLAGELADQVGAVGCYGCADRVCLVSRLRP